MKKIFLISLFLIFLSGCASTTFRDAPLGIKYKYVVTKIPEDFLKIPDPIYKIDTQNATDKDAAQWLIKSEKRCEEIEKRLSFIKQYQIDKIKKLNIPKEDIIEN